MKLKLNFGHQKPEATQVHDASGSSTGSTRTSVASSLLGRLGSSRRELQQMPAAGSEPKRHRTAGIGTTVRKAIGTVFAAAASTSANAALKWTSIPYESTFAGGPPNHDRPSREATSANKIKLSLLLGDDPVKAIQMGADPWHVLDQTKSPHSTELYDAATKAGAEAYVAALLESSRSIHPALRLPPFASTQPEAAPHANAQLHTQHSVGLPLSVPQADSIRKPHQPTQSTQSTRLGQYKPPAHLDPRSPAKFAGTPLISTGEDWLAKVGMSRVIWPTRPEFDLNLSVPKQIAETTQPASGASSIYSEHSSQGQSSTPATSISSGSSVKGEISELSLEDYSNRNLSTYVDAIAKVSAEQDPDPKHPSAFAKPVEGGPITSFGHGLANRLNSSIAAMAPGLPAPWTFPPKAALSVPSSPVDSSTNPAPSEALQADPVPSKHWSTRPYASRVKHRDRDFDAGPFWSSRRG